jgi:hypothetical protein
MVGTSPTMTTWVLSDPLGRGFGASIAPSLARAQVEAPLFSIGFATRGSSAMPKLTRQELGRLLALQEQREADKRERIRQNNAIDDDLRKMAYALLDRSPQLEADSRTQANGTRF